MIDMRIAFGVLLGVTISVIATHCARHDGYDPFAPQIYHVGAR